MAEKKESKKDRRKRLRALVRMTLKEVQQICGPVEKVDKVADQISNVVKQIKNLAEGSDAAELLSENTRRNLINAAEQFEEAKKQIDTFADACKKLQKALKIADTTLGLHVPTGILMVLAPVVVIVGIAGGTLRDRVTIEVENRSCDTITFPKILSLLPGVKLPPEIGTGGGKGSIIVPRTLTGAIKAQDNKISIKVLLIDIPIPAKDLNLNRSTWEKKPLGEAGAISFKDKEKSSYELVLICSK